MNKNIYLEKDAFSLLRQLAVLRGSSLAKTAASYLLGLASGEKMLDMEVDLDNTKTRGQVGLSIKPHEGEQIDGLSKAYRLPLSKILQMLVIQEASEAGLVLPHSDVSASSALIKSLREENAVLRERVMVLEGQVDLLKSVLRPDLGGHSGVSGSKIDNSTVLANSTVVAGEKPS
jgi:hypothetical protein